MDEPHPFPDLLGTIARVPLENGRQSYISWGHAQPDILLTIGEICRQHLNIAVFLGSERGYDYFMHVLGMELPDDATGFDLDSQSLTSDDGVLWGAQPTQRYGHHEHVAC